jgi:hypothetical protein
MAASKLRSSASAIGRNELVRRLEGDHVDVAFAGFEEHQVLASIDSSLGNDIV